MFLGASSSTNHEFSLRHSLLSTSDTSMEMAILVEFWMDLKVLKKVIAITDNERQDEQREWPG